MRDAPGATSRELRPAGDRSRRSDGPDSCACGCGLQRSWLVTRVPREEPGWNRDEEHGDGYERQPRHERFGERTDQGTEQHGIVRSRNDVARVRLNAGEGEDAKTQEQRGREPEPRDRVNPRMREQ